MPPCCAPLHVCLTLARFFPQHHSIGEVAGLRNRRIVTARGRNSRRLIERHSRKCRRIDYQCMSILYAERLKRSSPDCYLQIIALTKCQLRVVQASRQSKGCSSGGIHELTLDFGP